MRVWHLTSEASVANHPSARVTPGVLLDRLFDLFKFVGTCERYAEIKLPRREHSIERVDHRRADVQSCEKKQTSCRER